MNDWRDRAACLGTDDDTFFPHEGDTDGAARAVAICDTCPVADQCLTEALTDEGTLGARHRYGIRGGLTPAQRHTLSRANRSRP